MLMKTRHYSSSSLQQRTESLQHHIDILRSAKKDALLSARELRRANEKNTAQLDSLTEKLWISEQRAQVTLTGKSVNWKVLVIFIDVFLYSLFVSAVRLSRTINGFRATLFCGGQRHGSGGGTMISLPLFSSLPLCCCLAECFNKAVPPQQSVSLALTFRCMQDPVCADTHTHTHTR